MADQDPRGNPVSQGGLALDLSGRDLPLPGAISAQARAILAARYATPPALPPAGLDAQVWTSFVAEREALVLPLAEAVISRPGVSVEDRLVGDTTIYIATPDQRRAGGPKACFQIHGGGWVFGAGKIAKALAVLVAGSTGRIVHAVDYRMPPTFPFPVALEDCLTAYVDILQTFDAEDIYVQGDSAGGNLAAALMLKARDAGVARPGALFLNTPAVDLTAAGDTIWTNRGLDSAVQPQDITHAAPLYAGQTDLSHPYISPINGDLSSGFPPTYLRSGTRDLLLSDTVRMHAALRKAGVEADLYVGEGMPHGGFDALTGGTPEDQEAQADLERWLARQFS